MILHVAVCWPIIVLYSNSEWFNMTWTLAFELLAPSSFSFWLWFVLQLSGVPSRWSTLLKFKNLNSHPKPKMKWKDSKVLKTQPAQALATRRSQVQAVLGSCDGVVWRHPGEEMRAKNEQHKGRQTLPCNTGWKSTSCQATIWIHLASSNIFSGMSISKLPVPFCLFMTNCLDIEQVQSWIINNNHTPSSSARCPTHCSAPICTHLDVPPRFRPAEVRVPARGTGPWGVSTA